jgi:hypothetical protein
LIKDEREGRREFRQCLQFLVVWLNPVFFFLRREFGLRRRFLLRNFLSRIAGLLIFVSGSGLLFAGSVTYSVAAISTPNWSNIHISGIDDNGQVAGYGSGGAFIGSTSGYSIVPLPPGWSSATAYSINNSGQVTGYVNDGVAGTGSTDQAYIGDASGSTLVPLPTGAYYSVGYAINGSGQVSGYVAGIFSSGIGWAQAFIGSASGSATIPVPQGCSGCVYGLALNDSGEVVGNDLVASHLKAPRRAVPCSQVLLAGQINMPMP